MESTITSLANPTPETIRELSNRFSETKHVLEQRTIALEHFNKLPLERSVLYSKYVDMLSGLHLEKISVPKPTFEATIPSEISHLVEENTERTIGVQVDSQTVLVRIHKELERVGLVYSDIRTALSKNSELVSKYFGKIVGPEDDKFAALNNAFYTAGIFLYVPKGLKVNVPIRSLVLLRTPEAGVFSHNIIVAEEHSKVTFLQEAYSNFVSQPGSPETQSLYSESTEVYLGEEAEVNFASIQNLDENVHHLVNRRSHSLKDSKMNWTVGHIGGGITRSRMDSLLDGPGANAEDVEVVFGGGTQKFDIVTDLTHRAPSTTGSVLARGVLRDKSRSVFKGMIRIGKDAKNSRSYLAEHAMILSKSARADAIPGLEIETNEVRATHSGSVAQIDEEHVFYLTSRGLSESDAKKLIVLGFFHPAVMRIPISAVRAGIQYLIEEKWVGRKVRLPPREGMLPELEEESDEASRPTDLFEHHYKYR